MANKVETTAGADVFANDCTVDDLKTIFYCAGEVEGVKCGIPMHLCALKANKSNTRELKPYFAPAKKTYKHIKDCPCGKGGKTLSRFNEEDFSPYEFLEKLKLPVQKALHNKQEVSSYLSSDSEPYNMQISTLNGFYRFCSSTPLDTVFFDKKISNWISDARNQKSRKYGIFGLQLVEGKYVQNYTAKSGKHCIQVAYPFDDEQSHKPYYCFAYFDNPSQFRIVEKKLSRIDNQKVCICIFADWRTNKDNHCSYTYLSSSSQVLFSRK